MRRFFAALCALFLLAGCSAPAETPEAAPPPPSEAAYVTALTVPLVELEPYEPWQPMEPDTVEPETVGEVLCDETLPDGTRVVCYWHPDRLTDPAYQYDKYWAVHRGDSLLRFAAESSRYEYGYGVRAFEDVLGRSGFRVEAPRGAAYDGRDYYVLDGDGVPRLLMDCTNNVLERDVDGDGVTELIWDYHGGQFVTAAFLRRGAVYQVELMSLLAERLPFPALVSGDVGGWREEGLPVSILVGGWDAVDEPGPKTTIEGYLRLTEDSVVLDVPADQVPLEAWAAKRYTLIGGAPACQDIASAEDEAEWTVLGPAIPAPREWADQDRRNGADTWEDIEPQHFFMQMVSVQDGWMVVSAGHGIGTNADNYVYRTHDGGVTWQEATKLEEAGRYPCALAFFDDLHAMVGIEQFDGAPLFVTQDGGESWEQADFFLLDDPDSWHAYHISRSGDQVSVYLFRRAGGGAEYRQVVSRDWGETWTHA